MSAAAGVAALLLSASASGAGAGAGEASPAARPADARTVVDARTLGAKGDGRTDDSRALQAALDAVRLAGGGVVYLPAGTYLLAPPAAPGGGRGAFTIGNGTWLRGDGPATVLRVKGGVGSYRALLTAHPGPEVPLEDVTISDLRVDQNCGGSGGWVGPGGADFVVFLAFGGRNLTVERVRFDPICGVNTVVLNSPAARDLAVRDCRFRFEAGPTRRPWEEYDNSAVYLHGRGLQVTGNTFEAEPGAHARGAIELHGAEGVAAGNVSRGYRSCVRVVGTSEPGEAPPAGGNGFAVTGNVCRQANDAINVWALTGHPVQGVTISGNTIALGQLDHLRAAPGLEHFSGISFVWDAVSGALDGAIRDVVIEGNTVSAQPARGRSAASAYGSAGIALTPMGSISGLVVRGNVLRDLPTKGIQLQAMGPGARATAVRIEGNVILDAGGDPSAGPHRAGISLGGLLQDVEVTRNTVAGSRPPSPELDGIRSAPTPGSARVAVRDNALGPGYRLTLRSLEEAGPDGGARVRADAAGPDATARP